MYWDNKIWMANDAEGSHINILPKMANRHGLVCGATGTGKTVTLKVMAEAFSDMGVPVFMADVKGDIAGMMAAGADTEDMQKRIARFGLAEAGFHFHGYPVTLWDIFGRDGIQLRTTITELGPVLLARILRLNELQTDILTIVFKIAEDNNLLLIDTKDLKAMLYYVSEHAKDFAADYGKISSVSIGAITRALVALELEGGEIFFGEPALNIHDWMVREPDGRGMINVLASDSLIGNGRLYSTFLLWLLSELFEKLPEVGDLEKPKMVFFFDEAHLLFNDVSKTLLDKIVQVVKLIRSKGVGVYFCSQSPKDIPDEVLSQLGNKVEHGLRAYTPAEQKVVKAAAASFRANPAFDTLQAIMSLGTGEAVVSFLDEKGVPGIAQIAYILPPQSRMAAAAEAERDQSIKASLLYSKYAESYDPDSAYEFFQRLGLEQQAEEERQRAEAEKAAEEAALKKEQDKAQAIADKEREKALAKAEKDREKELARAEKEREREEKQKQRAKDNAIKQVGNSVLGTLGREAGKKAGSAFGSIGKKVGGNLGAAIGRGIVGTLFKK